MNWPILSYLKPVSGSLSRTASSKYWLSLKKKKIELVPQVAKENAFPRQSIHFPLGRFYRQEQRVVPSIMLYSAQKNRNSASVVWDVVGCLGQKMEFSEVGGKKVLACTGARLSDSPHSRRA
jgi:hypothetical protein